MLVIYPFSVVDQELALKNARWIAELGEYKSHDMFILSDRRCDPQIMEQVVKIFTGVFRIAKHRLTQNDVDGWPEGANQMFSLATALIQNTREWPYFFWMEPDAIPIAPGWLDKLEAEYKRAGKPFMGDRVQVGDIPLHMSGVGIYQNPIYNLAGECYRAHETAWDMAAKDQIVPNAHFTNLIEHAWKHPTFKDQFEVNTQIAKETILFHSSKDGSLIDRLREKAASVHNQNSVATEPTSDMSSREEIGTRPAQPSPEPIYDIFIRTYPGDYEWLKYCLQSIGNFCSGFRKIWIVSPAGPPSMITPVEFTWKQMNDETEDGYLAQQITKLYADTITDYQADYILHVDSDVIFTRPVTPGDFLNGNKVIWYYTPYTSITTPWQPIMEKFMGFPMPYEFMRRLPLMVPRWLYPKLREFAFNLHGIPIGDYIKNQPMRAFSEFNAMGCYAYFQHGDKFHFQNTLDGTIPGPLARQFHSWSGLTPEVKAEIDTILGGDVACSEKKKIPSVVSDAAPTVLPASASIKELPSGVWVLHNDQISDWVIQEGRLDHDQNLLPHILRHIRQGDTVVDAGAFIGDHTIAYSNAVGKTGTVYAFEPNPLALKCLIHNLNNKGCTIFDVALGDQDDVSVPISGNNGNYGGSYLGTHMKVADAVMQRLDSFLPDLRHLDFMKIDVEGCELKLLKGAETLIDKFHPIMVIEMNSVALERQDTTPGNVLEWLDAHDYNYSVIQENCGFTDPLFDILCLPKQPPETVQKDEATAHALTEPTASPPVAPRNVSIPDAVQLLVNQLQEIAEVSPGNKAIVTSKLVYAGLRPVIPKKPKVIYAEDPFAEGAKRRRKRKQAAKEHSA